MSYKEALELKNIINQELSVQPEIKTYIKGERKSFSVIFQFNRETIEIWNGFHYELWKNENEIFL